MARGTTEQGRYPFKPDYAVPPGRTLSSTLQALGIDQKEFARRTGYTEKHISQVMQGKASITPEAALRFEKVTGVPARLWNNLETQYREQLALLKSHEKSSEHLDWLDEIPIKELIKRGAIKKCDSQVEQLEACLGFFGVAEVRAWREGWKKRHIAFRKSICHESCDGAIAAWVRLAELQAQALECQPFDDAHFREALLQIRGLTTKPTDVFVTQMRVLCAAAGVAVALVREVPKAPISGAARWLSKSKAMIALNLRGKANDRFWFTFFHEAGHILNDDRTEVFVDIDYADDPREQAANDFAGEWLIPSTFRAALAGLKSAAAVTEFASEIGIHPGIVAGRLQHDKLVPFTHFNGLKVKLVWSEG